MEHLLPEVIKSFSSMDFFHIDDNTDMLDMVGYMLAPYVREVKSFASPEKGLEAILTKPKLRHEGIIVDMRMPGMNGDVVIRKAAEEKVYLPTVILSGDFAPEAYEEFAPRVLELTDDTLTEILKEHAKVYNGHPLLYFPKELLSERGLLQALALVQMQSLNTLSSFSDLATDIAYVVNDRVTMENVKEVPTHLYHLREAHLLTQATLEDIRNKLWAFFDKKGQFSYLKGGAVLSLEGDAVRALAEKHESKEPMIQLAVRFKRFFSSVASGRKIITEYDFKSILDGDFGKDRASGLGKQNHAYTTPYSVMNHDLSRLSPSEPTDDSLQALFSEDNFTWLENRIKVMRNARETYLMHYKALPRPDKEE